MQTFWANVVGWLGTVGWKIVAVIGGGIGGVLLIKGILAVERKILGRSRMEKTVVDFVLAASKLALYILLIFVLAAIASIPLSPLVTALGAVALAVGLALKDSLSNLASGIMLVAVKPFVEGDYVDLDGTAGTVQAVKLLTTELLTPDNKKITVPNARAYTASVVNHTALATRRVEWSVAVAFGTDVEAVRRAVKPVFDQDARVLSDPAPAVVLTAYADSALSLSVRAWVKSPDYWDVFFELGEKLPAALSAEGIEIPYPKVEIIKN